MMYDFIIIGAGITGASIARELSKYKVSVLVLEKENDAANHATIANSAIVHAGHDPEPGTLKALLNVEGNQLYDRLEKELEIPLLRSGAFMVAHDEQEEDTLKFYYQRAKANGVTGVELISGDEARKQEPNLSKSVTLALNLPSTKVTYPWEVAVASLENAVDNGVVFKRSQEVNLIYKQEGVFTVKTKQEATFKSRYIINAAGAFATRVAGLTEEAPPYKITPRKGEYMVLDRRVKGFINRTLYPCPTDKGKGTLLVPQVHGNILVGPNSVWQDSPDDVTTSKSGLKEIKQGAARLADNIPFHKTIRTFAGVRATSTHKDFYIKESIEKENFIHVAGIDSPGISAAPAIGRYVVEDIIMKKEALVKNSNFNPKRKHIKLFDDMDDDEKKEAFKNDRRYGNLVCKCERITEADIVRHIHRSVPVDTVKGIKKRARAGAGLCQGGYCQHTIIHLLAKELNKDVTEVEYYAKGTTIFKEETKVKKR